MATSYIIEQELGRGGMSIVYVARHPRTGQRVALKLLAPWSDQADKRSLAREMRVHLRLDHPCIVRVLEIGDSQGKRPFLVSELMPGGTLRDRLRQQPLSPGEALTVVRQVASALAYAHGQRLIHRDVKPENIFLDGRGNVKLGDFGLAKSAEGGMTVTLPGISVGAVDYMAPEQFRAQRLTPVVDVFQLGMLTHELLSSRHLGLHRSMEGTLRRRMQGLELDLPPTGNDPLDRLIRQAISPDPARRPDALAFARRLEKALAVAPRPVLPGTAFMPAPVTAALAPVLAPARRQVDGALLWAVIVLAALAAGLAAAGIVLSLQA